MLSRAAGFLKRPLSLNIIINTFGSYVAVGFSFAYYLIFARIFTREELGVLGVLLSVAYVAANVLDLGSTQTIYAFLPELIKDRTKQYYSFLKTILMYQVILAAGAVALLAFFFPYIDRVFLKTSASTLQMNLVACAILLFVMQNIVQNILLASKKILELNVLINISNAGRTLLLLILAYYNNASLDNVLITIGIAGPLLFLLPVSFHKRKTITLALQTPHHIPLLNMKYTFTNLLSTQIFNLALRMDLFLLSYFNLKDQLGTYSLAQKIVLSVMTAYVGITQVLSPVYTLIKTKGELSKALKTTFAFMVIPIAAYITLLYIPDSVFRLSFTKTFADTSQVARSLALPYVLSACIHILLLFVLYTVKKPIYALWSNIVFLLSVTVTNFALIPRYGVYAPSIALSLSFAIVIIILVSTSYYEYRKLAT